MVMRRNNIEVCRLQMRCAPPTLHDLKRHALFFDIDGTLADIAPTPDLAMVSEQTRDVVTRLLVMNGGAVALISGRQLSDIDRMVGLANLPAAGIHGAQMRAPGGAVVTDDALAREIGVLDEALRPRLAGMSGVTVERKPMSIAMHYRAQPSRDAEVAALAAELVRERPGLKYMIGKMIVEILPAAADKGSAIAKLMQQVPFAGRIPLFAGDDTTDEDGFIAVNGMSGISIKIGHGPSSARFGFDEPEDFRAWLATLVQQNKGPR